MLKCVLFAVCVVYTMAAGVPCKPTPFADLPMKNFDLKRFVESGVTWHQVGAFPWTTSDVREAFSFVDGELRVAESGRLPDTHQCATYHYRGTERGGVISAADMEDPSFTADIAVMATDYDTYYFEYSCFGLSDGVCANFITSLWVSNTERSVSNALAQRAERVFGDLCLKYSGITMTGKTGTECSLE